MIFPDCSFVLQSKGAGKDKLNILPGQADDVPHRYFRRLPAVMRWNV